MEIRVQVGGPTQTERYVKAQPHLSLQGSDRGPAMMGNGHSWRRISHPAPPANANFESAQPASPCLGINLPLKLKRHESRHIAPFLIPQTPPKSIQPSLQCLHYHPLRQVRSHRVRGQRSSMSSFRIWARRSPHYLWKKI